MAVPSEAKRSGLARYLSLLGPGLISGAANDDPSCISTYSVAGASFGYATLWTAPLCFPLIFAVQLMCSRLGMVTGRGLSGAVRIYYPRWVVACVCPALVVANVINLGADLGGMAEVSALVTGLSRWAWLALYTGFITAFLLWSSYKPIERLFKWLTLGLFAYIGAGILARPDWIAVARSTVIPGGSSSLSYLMVLVGILGATMSPYLLFWQSAGEVELEYSKGRRTVGERRGADPHEIGRSRLDVLSGAFFSRLIVYFITITTAATLFAHGRRTIQTAQEAAEALKPLAGDAAYALFAAGLIGTGVLAVAVLAGSSAYAVSEAAGWQGHLEQRPRFARRFYRVLVSAMIAGACLNAAGINSVHLLFGAAVINGTIAAPLIYLVVRLTSRVDVMGEHVISRPIRWLGWASMALTGAAALVMLVSFLRD